MASIQVTHTIDDLESDCRKIATGAPAEFRKVIRDAAVVGNNLAKGNARRHSGTHGKWYPGTFSVGAVSAYYGFGGGSIEVEYGPVSARRQGGMSFEFGSRNQPPHLDLAKSADFAGVKLQRAASDALGRMFWPNS